MASTLARDTAPATPDDRAARGRAVRGEVPRRSHADWVPAAGRPDPVAVLEQQAASRVPELVPLRYGRMLTSPFAFFRGAAAVMAADLAVTPRSGMTTQLCGDAHVANFGGFAAPDRVLVFDLNDFDETLPGPWEWDVARLAASVEIAGRDLGHKPAARQTAVRAGIRAYREAIREFASMRQLDVWYSRLNAADILARVGQRVDADDRRGIAARGAKARTKDSLRAFSRLTHEIDGAVRIVSDAPLIVPIEELVDEDMPSEELEAAIVGLLRGYARTLRPDLRALLARYDYVHLARKVVGVGSVGTRAWIVLLVGRDRGDPLFLQVKEAQSSVLEPHTGKARQRHHGQRVVEGQWLMQAASDIFLGWLRAEGIDGQQRDFYVRQLWDWKVGPDLETMRPAVLQAYAQLCGWTLARAHARSGDSIAIGAYLGSGEAFDRAMTEFADRYADQNERDYATVAAAAEAGTITASAP